MRNCKREIRQSDLSGLGQELLVGGISLRNRVFLAPMSGVTDIPFRRLAWRFGAGLVVSEMVASDALVGGHAEMEIRMQGAGLPLHMVQLAGREERWLTLAARMAEDQGAHLIDLNLGCPARRVTTGLCGSALMREPDLALRLIEAVVKAVRIPVTVKMRLGWDSTSINAAEIAAGAESAGAAMITVHGRTRCQFYKGAADWEMIGTVRDRIRVPLVVNGDIRDLESACAARRAAGADAVMVGRACYGAPWLPGRIAGNRLWVEGRLSSLCELATEHFEAMLSCYGTRPGLRQARKHLAWYFDRVDTPGDSTIRRLALTTDDPAAVLEWTARYFQSAEDRIAA